MLTDHDTRHATRLITTGQADTAVEVTKNIQNIKNTSISPQTIRRELKKKGMKAVVRKKKPLLAPRHKKNRLDWALEHKDWTEND